MTKRIVILGGGTGGTMMANRLRRAYEHAEAEITVVDRDDRHVYQPGLLFVPFGLTDAEEITRPRQRQLRDGIRFLEAEIDRVELDADLVHLGDGATLPYDVLIVATGTRLQPEDTEGMSGPGWMENVFTFYTPEGATALAQALRAFDAGRVVVSCVDMPIKCPVAPLEFSFLADWFFHDCQAARPGRADLRDAARRGVHEAGRLRASRRLARSEKDIELVSDFAHGRGRRRGWQARSATTSGRSRSTSLVDDPPPRRGGLRRALARPRRRPRVRPDRSTHAPVGREAERVRDRRRDERPDVEGGLRHALRGRGAHPEHPALPRREGVRHQRSTATRTASSRPVSTRRC